MAPGINMADLAFMQWLSNEEKERQKEIVKARNYYEGDATLKITERMRSLLGLSSADDVNFKLNIIRVIVRAVTERLSVADFSSADDALAQWAWDTWQHNRFDVKQDQLHDNAINDGEAFVIVDWEKDAQFACWTPHPRYTGSQVDGDEFGCKIQYENDDINQEVLFASKRWRERLPDNQYRMRMTLYYPDRIEKYHAVLGSEMWVPFQDEDDNGVWPLPWVDLQGMPLGVPVFHFMNVDGRPEARDAWGPQDGLNQLFLDTLASNRQAAFRIYVALGFVPTSDGGPLKTDKSNALHVEPGMIVGTKDISNGASFTALEGSDIGPAMDAIQQFITIAASITDTPVARFQLTGAIASAETQKQYNEALLKKTKKRQTRFGDSYEDCLAMSYKLSQVFGGFTPGTPKAAADPEKAVNDLETVWEVSETQTIADKVAESTALLAAGVPQEQVWSQVWGYSDEKIAEMMLLPSYAMKQAATQQLLGMSAQAKAKNG